MDNIEKRFKVVGQWTEWEPSDLDEVRYVIFTPVKFGSWSLYREALKRGEFLSYCGLIQFREVQS